MMQKASFTMAISVKNVLDNHSTLYFLYLIFYTILLTTVFAFPSGFIAVTKTLPTTRDKSVSLIIYLI